jgi:hypothetical protein
MAEMKTKMPRPTRISRKLALSSEKVVVLGGPENAEVAGHKCTLLKTGCFAHTC